MTSYEVLANGSEAGRIAGARWMWTLAFGCYEDQPPTHCCAVTREGCDGGLFQEVAGE